MMFEMSKVQFVQVFAYQPNADLAMKNVKCIIKLYVFPTERLFSLLL